MRRANRFVSGTCTTVSEHGRKLPHVSFERLVGQDDGIRLVLAFGRFALQHGVD